MKEYSLGFCFTDHAATRVILIKKNQTWQKGFLNGLGGAVDPGETPLQSMCREFYEETKLGKGPKQNIGWKYLGWMGTAHSWKVHIFSARWWTTQLEPWAWDPSRWKYNSEEGLVRVYDVMDLPHLPILSNLSLLIPLCVGGLRGFTYEIHYSGESSESGDALIKVVKQKEGSDVQDPPDANEEP